MYPFNFEIIEISRQDDIGRGTVSFVCIKGREMAGTLNTKSQETRKKEDKRPNQDNITAFPHFLSGRLSEMIIQSFICQWGSPT
jgi:hypothetical protein